MDIKRAVIGACGFLGEELVEALASDHEYTNHDLLIVHHSGRMKVPAYRVPEVVKTLEDKEDYVRRVEIPRGHPLARYLFKEDQ